MAQGSLLGNPAKLFTVTSLDGKTISLDSLKGKVVVLNFWATRCPPCRAEIPELIQFYRDFEKKGVIIIGLGVRNSDLVGLNDRNATLLEFSKANRINYPIVNDLENRVARFYGIRWIPTTFVIDRNGIIRDTRVGGIDKQELLKMVGPYLSEITKE
jgi:peroxiredoxin